MRGQLSALLHHETAALLPQAEVTRAWVYWNGLLCWALGGFLKRDEFSLNRFGIPKSGDF
jgi:hypothetical protein